MFYEERDELEEIRQQSKRRLDRKFERARRHDTRAAILSLLAEDGGWAELTVEEIRAGLSAALPAKRCGNHYHLQRHIDVLCKSGLVLKTNDEPPRYKLR